MNLEHVGKPYALVGHVRFDKGGAMRIVPLLYLSTRVSHMRISKVVIQSQIKKNKNARSVIRNIDIINSYCYNFYSWDCKIITQLT